MSVEAQHFYEFQNFQLDLVERELRRDGTRVPLTPKAFHLLQLLVENHGHIVDKEKLISEIWADSFVEEGNLAVSATALRKALDDNANNPTFIETIPRRGYRFIAPVSKTDRDHSISQKLNGKDSLRTETENAPAYRRYVTLLLVIVVAAAAATAWYAQRIWMGPAATAPILSTPFAASRLHSSSDIRIAISPDGEHVAYTEEAGGLQSVWIRRLVSGESLQIVPPSNDHYYDLAFSQDGTTLYFVRRPEESHAGLALYRVSTFGGIPSMLLTDPLDWISVSPDDKQIAFIQCNYKPDDFCALFTVDADGQNKRRLLTRSGSVHLLASQFSPDGGSIAFVSGRGGGTEPAFQVARIDLSSGTETPISDQRFYQVTNMKWLPSGNDLLLTVQEYEEGISSIWRVSVSNAVAARVTNDAVSYLEINLDRKGEKMATVQTDNDFHIFVQRAGTSEKLIAAKELAVTANGEFVYSTFDGEIWSVDPTGGERRQLTTGPAGDFSPRPSPDGRHIFFTTNRTGSQQVWRMGTDGSSPVQITKTGGRPCGVTPDGKWLYYHSFDRKLARISTDGGDETPIYDKSRVTRPVCSPDGKLIAYFFFEKEFKIGILDTADGSVIRVMNYGDGKSLALRMAWSPDSRTINFVTDGDGKSSLWQQGIDEKDPRLIADLGAEEVRDLAVTSDGNVALIKGKRIHNAVLVTGLE